MRAAKIMVAAVMLTAGAAGAQERYRERYNDAPFSPFAANLWAGVAYDYINDNGGTLTGSNNLGFNFGGDLGLRFTPFFGIVVLAEYVPILSISAPASVVNAGVGVRLTPSPWTQFVLAGTYSRLGGAYGDLPGFGLKAIGFAPVLSGFGPYLQLAYNNFSNQVTLVNVNAGISYSF